ncbi:Protein of unknown function [Pyronema omphalodes CBS 100304]|uniref:Uncharacterized protein n=1 Tax=Pyronema omphalodes (strain CBS 100304) TaxID=1076935 RepID=U4LNS1_PYROM|nr:Protein of unknown function [Pyronema omphalodes CBS 100304]
MMLEWLVSGRLCRVAGLRTCGSTEFTPVKVKTGQWRLLSCSSSV